MGISRTVLRNPATLRTSAMLAGVCAVVPLVAREAAWAWWSGAALLLLLGWWPRVVVDGNGLTVRNLRSRSVRWSDVAAVEWRPRLTGYEGLVLLLVDETRIEVGAVATNGRGAAWALDAFEQVAQRWRAAGQAPREPAVPTALLAIEDRSARRYGTWLVASFGCLAAVGLGFAYHTWIVMPGTYERLREHGVATTASVRCASEECRLTYTFGGRTRTNAYNNDLSQFQGRAGVPVLVDPEAPGTMYTRHDVHRGTNAGFSFLGVFLLVGSVGLLVFVVRIARLRPPKPAGAPGTA